MKKYGVNVFVAGDVAGVLTRSDLDDDTFLFGYREHCPDDHAVSLTMPVVSDQYDSMGELHPVFEMNLPEGLLRHKLEMVFAKAVKDFDSLSLLDIVGKSQIGRLRYSSERTLPVDVPTQSVEQLLAYRGAEDLFGDLMDRYAQYSGVSGMQPKVLLRDSAVPLDRLTEKGATHIVKSFDAKEYPELAANEFFSMQASRHSGLLTANTQLSVNRGILVVERFDRTAQGDYLGFEDFCVLSGMRAGGRYNSSYEDLARKVAAYVSPENTPDSMARLFGSVVLASAIRNGDAHLKNFGVLYDRPGENVRLAPVYDMLSTVPYNPRDAFALEMDESKQFPTRAQLVKFGRQACGLTNKKVENLFEQVIEGVGRACREMEAYAVKFPDFQAPAKILIRTFENGIADLTAPLVRKANRENPFVDFPMDAGGPLVGAVVDSERSLEASVAPPATPEEAQKLAIKAEEKRLGVRFDRHDPRAVAIRVAVRKGWNEAEAARLAPPELPKVLEREKPKARVVELPAKKRGPNVR